MDAGITARDGWDFSRMREQIAPAPWDYLTVVGQLLAGTDQVMDQGTGGGELILTLSEMFATCLAADRSERMLRTARRNWRQAGVSNLSAACMDNTSLAAAACTFDVVLNRHAPFDLGEIARVLRPGGHFVTQQVAPDNARSLFECFDWEDVFPPDWMIPIRDRTFEFEDAGLAVLSVAEYAVDWWIEDVESLLFWLHSVPTPDEFELVRHWQGLNAAEARLRDNIGYRTHEARELLIARRV